MKLNPKFLVHETNGEHYMVSTGDTEFKGITKNNYEVIVNRVQAIHHAMDIAQKHDIIVLAGKGHETYQEVGGVKHHLDEREVVAAYLEEMR